VHLQQACGNLTIRCLHSSSSNLGDEPAAACRDGWGYVDAVGDASDAVVMIASAERSSVLQTDAPCEHAPDVAARRHLHSTGRNRY
jgi:hypothetical protein